MKNQNKKSATLEGNSVALEMVTQTPEFIVSDGVSDTSCVVNDSVCTDGHIHQLKRSISMFTRKLQNTSQDTKRVVGMAVDFVAVVLALAIAFLLRLTVVDITQLWPVFILLPFFSVAVFNVVGVYAMVVRFSSLEDNYALLKGVVLSSLIALVLLFLAQPDPNPRSIFIIYGLLLMVFCGGSRVLWKALVGGNTSDTGRPIAIYGAGELGRQVMQICRNGTEYRPVLWLDDDKKYHNRYLANARVLDPKHLTTPDVLKAHGVDTIHAVSL